MNINVQLNNDNSLTAEFNSFKLIASPSPSNEGDDKNPEPADYFYSSIALCAGYYVQSFCLARKISTKDISIQSTNIPSQNDKYKMNFFIEINLPTDFPKKYHKAVISAAKNCTIKKIIDSTPEFEVKITTK